MNTVQRTRQFLRNVLLKRVDPIVIEAVSKNLYAEIAASRNDLCRERTFRHTHDIALGRIQSQSR